MTYQNSGSHLDSGFFPSHKYIQARNVMLGQCAYCSYSEDASWHERPQKTIFQEIERNKALDALLAELKSPDHPIRNTQTRVEQPKIGYAIDWHANGPTSEFRLLN